jgi:hypothetical protein
MPFITIPYDAAWVQGVNAMINFFGQGLLIQLFLQPASAPVIITSGRLPFGFASILPSVVFHCILKLPCLNKFGGLFGF